MKKFFAAFVLVTPLFFANAASAQGAPKCKASAKVTIQFKIEGKPAVTADGWGEFGFGAKPCEVAFVRGKGGLPPGCTDGKTMEATGTVEATELQTVTLNVTSARCF